MKEQVAFTEMPLPERNQLMLIPRELTPSEEQRCQYVLSRSQRKTPFCLDESCDNCAGCGTPLCSEHTSEKSLYVPAATRYASLSLIAYRHVPLCLRCAELPREQVEAIRALRRALNGWSEEKGRTL